MRGKEHFSRVLQDTAFVHDLSGCVRYSRETGAARLTEARVFEHYPFDERVLVQPEVRTEGCHFGLSVFDAHISWMTHRTIAGYPVAIQMLDRDQEATAWPIEVIGQKRIIVDILLAPNMYLRMKPFLEGIQSPAYRLQLVNKLSATRIHHDSFRLQDTREETRPGVLIMLGRYFDPFLIPSGHTTVTEGRLFPTPPIKLGGGKYFWNGSSLFSHERTDKPYAIEALVQVMEDQKQVSHLRNRREIDLIGNTWTPTGVDATVTCADSYTFNDEGEVVTVLLHGFEGCQQVRMPRRFVFDQPTLKFAIKEDEITAVVDSLESNIQLLIDSLVKGNEQVFDLAGLQGW